MTWKTIGAVLADPAQSPIKTIDTTGLNEKLVQYGGGTILIIIFLAMLMRSRKGETGKNVTSLFNVLLAFVVLGLGVTVFTGLGRWFVSLFIK